MWEKTVLTFNEYLDLHGIAYGKEDYPDHAHATFMTVLPDLQAQVKQSYEAGARDLMFWLQNYSLHGGKLSLFEVLDDLEAHSPYKVFIKEFREDKKRE